MFVCTFRNYFTLNKIAKFSETLLILAVLENLNFVHKSNIRKEVWKMHSSLNFQIWNHVRAACKQFYLGPFLYFCSLRKKTDIFLKNWHIYPRWKEMPNLQPRGAFVKVKIEKKHKCGTKFEQVSQNTSSSLLALTFTLPYTYHV